ncbi:MAG: hypothetical protein KGI80_03510 [Verrucomicrobiota bacterium]|nr:hypothetical protein [Verrucomicrobiota bacterium]
MIGTTLIYTPLSKRAAITEKLAFSISPTLRKEAISWINRFPPSKKIARSLALLRAFELAYNTAKRLPKKGFFHKECESERILQAAAIAICSPGRSPMQLLQFANTMKRDRDTLLTYIAETIAVLELDQKKLLAIVNEIESNDQRESTLSQIVIRMAEINRSSNELLVIANEIKDPEIRDESLKEAVIDMVYNNCNTEELLAVTKAIEKYPLNRDEALAHIATRMALEGGSLQDLFAFTNKIEKQSIRDDGLKEIAIAMARQNRNQQEVLSITNEIKDQEIRTETVKEVSLIATCATCDQGTVLAILKKIEDNEKDKWWQFLYRRKTLESVLCAMTYLGRKPEEIVAIAKIGHSQTRHNSNVRTVATAHNIEAKLCFTRDEVAGAMTSIRNDGIQEKFDPQFDDNLRKVAIIMASKWRNKEEILAITREIEDRDKRNSTLKDLVITMTSSNYSGQQILAVANAIDSPSICSSALTESVIIMAHAGLNKENWTLFTDKITEREDQNTLGLINTIATMLSKNCDPGDLCRIANERAHLFDDLDSVLKHIAIMMASAGYDQEKWLAITGKIGNEEGLRESVLSDILTGMVETGHGKEEVFRIANKIRWLETRDSALKGAALAMVAKRCSCEEILSIATEIENYHTKRDSALRSIISEMISLGRGQENLIAIATEIENLSDRKDALQKIANSIAIPPSDEENMTVIANKSQQAILAMVNAIEDPIDRDQTLRNIAVAMIEVNRSQEEILAIANAIEDPINRDKALVDLVFWMFRANRSQEELITIISAIQEETSRDSSLWTVAKLMLAKGRSQEEVLTVITA